MLRLILMLEKSKVVSSLIDLINLKCVQILSFFSLDMLQRNKGQSFNPFKPMEFPTNQLDQSISI